MADPKRRLQRTREHFRLRLDAPHAEAQKSVAQMRKGARSAKPPKSVVAFKVDPDLAALLDAIPNKSEFIRAAVQARLVATCPLCRGSGIAPPNTRDELARLVADHPLVACVHCGAREPRPCHAPGHCEDDARILAFEKYGLFSCSQCFSEARACDACTRPFWPSRGTQGRCDSCRKQAGTGGSLS